MRLRAKRKPQYKLTKKKPEKALVLSFKSRGGRSSSGRISVRHRGGGAKRLYRLVEFGQKKLDIKATVKALEYDPNRTAFLALIEYEDGTKAYILAPDKLKVGDSVICSEKADIKIGNRMKLKNIPVGTEVHNVEIEKDRGGKLVRSAGTSAKVVTHEGKYTHLEMASKEVRKVLQECFASVGQVSHPGKRFEKEGKAGRKRLKGWRPSVRGTAMNPPDHPHGGGTGKSPIGMKYPKTPWGKPAIGVRTRKKKWTDKLIIKRRKTKR